MLVLTNALKINVQVLVRAIIEPDKTKEKNHRHKE
jgi:hypothetical protein